MAIERKKADWKPRVGEQSFPAIFMSMDEGALLQNGSAENRRRLSVRREYRRSRLPKGDLAAVAADLPRLAHESGMKG